MALKFGSCLFRSSRIVFGWKCPQVVEKSTKAPCPGHEEEHFKKTCKVVEEVPCEQRARGDDCTILPEEKKEDCPKPIQDCTAVATTEPAENECQEGQEEEVSLAESPRSSDEDDEGSDPKVVVIGAGLSGLAAANRLATMGVHNITILEATNRAGGRILSTAFGDTIVNLGGTWYDDDICVGDIDYMDNPVIFHANSFGLVNSNKHLHLARSMVTECDGSPLPLAASFLALSKMRRIMGVAQSLKATSPYADLGRVDSYIGLRMQQELRSMADELKAPAASVFTALAILATGKSFMGCDGFGPFVSVPGSNIKIPLGCTGVLSTLLLNVARYVRYCKEVVNISWGSLSGLNGKRALVRTADGCQYNADFVVFTPSLGVMKSDHDKLFCPALPSAKVKSLDSMEFESINKIFLYYKQPMSSWRQDRIFWRLDEEETKSLKGPLNGLREIRELFGSQKVISVTLVGKGAVKSETVSEKELVEELTNYIRKRSGDCAPYPEDIHRTKWSHSKFFRGARPTKGSAALGTPLPSCGSPNPPVIYFAGDSTCDVNPGTTKGAFTSGLREADRILANLPGNKNEYQATDTCLQLQVALSA